MRDRREIHDSEEEDEWFSPLNSPMKGDAPHVVATAECENEGQSMGQLIGGSRSTDPDFFKRIYEDQQKAVAASVTDSMSDTRPHIGSSDKLRSSNSKARNNSSSITDPTMKNKKKRAACTTETKELGNLTQVTTPSAPSFKHRDVYDFSLSDEEGVPAGPARTASKRRKVNSDDPDSVAATVISSPPPLSTSHHHTEDHENESPRPMRKKRKSTRNQSLREIPEDVDLLVIPTAANMSEPHDETNVDHDSPDVGSVVPDTHGPQVASHVHPLASFFIAPPDTLTSSQKQEYLRVSGCSDLDREEKYQHASLPVSKSAREKSQRSTSNSMSTIAYTTPSQYASSIAPLPILETLDDRSSNVATSSERIRLEKSHPYSSPDELNAFSTTQGRRSKRHMSDVDEEDELAQHESWDSDKIGHDRETCVPISCRHRPGLDRDSVRATQAEVDTGSTRKRRQKKGEQVETAHRGPWASEQNGSHREHHAPRPSRRSSRVMVEEDDEIQYPEQSMPDTCPPGDASYAKTNDAEPAPVSSSQQAPDQAAEIVEGVDPEFWAAMPEFIRQEMMSEQRSARPNQASRTRRSGRASQATSGLVPAHEEPPQAKKRGRKQKGHKIGEEPVAVDKPAAASEEPEARPSPAPAAAAKRKRGRPRKAEAAPLPPPSEIEMSDLPMEAPELLSKDTEEPSVKHTLRHEPPQDIVEVPKAPAKRGRKKKAAEAPTVHPNELQEPVGVEDEGTGSVGSMEKLAVEPSHSKVDTLAVSIEIEDRQALRDISNAADNVASKNGLAMDQKAEKRVTDEAEQQQEATVEPKVKEAPKSASTPGQQGKVPLRVGLSKRSRIAPLLKVIRK